LGLGSNSAIMRAAGSGGNVLGYARTRSNAPASTYATIRTSFTGFAFGYALQTNLGTGTSLIETTAGAGIAMGMARDGGSVRATAYASFASGFADGTIILASGVGSFTRGVGPLTASGQGSSAFGEGAEAGLLNQIAHASGIFAAIGDAQKTGVVMRTNTTDATPTEMTLDGAAAGAGNRLAIDDEHTYRVQVEVVARRDTGADNAEFTRKVLIERTAGVTALVGAVQTVGTDIGSNAGIPPAAWSVAITASDANDALIITVTGANNVRWVAYIRAVEVQYAD
jgi:hypothetical protein